MAREKENVGVKNEEPDKVMEETFSPLFPFRRWLFWRKCRCVNDYVLRLRRVCEVCLISSFFSACAWYVFFLCDVLKALDTSCAAMPCKVSCMARCPSVGQDAVFSLLVRPDRCPSIDSRRPVGTGAASPEERL